ncbi:hypothetical protein [Ancylobacter sp. SL191]|uniref:hypothetical protein n=1 Tax=Ancylobacter sp. SL191 TaxID=2995166 RepID=UPI0022719843|nr:hypothetical protein [Ancylobacter sp. SL191]WAC26260.1 hypothetical protein OU996_14730 [Ancylobacter sp. SL191]
MAGYNKPLKKTERLHMLISPEEMEAVDAWREKAGIASRSDAIRRLTAMAIFIDGRSEQIASRYDALWSAYDVGSRMSLEISKGGIADWKTRAKFALKALSDLALPMARLSGEIFMLVQLLGIVRQSPDVIEAAEAIERAEKAAQDRADQLAAAFASLDEGRAE